MSDIGLVNFNNKTDTLVMRSELPLGVSLLGVIFTIEDITNEQRKTNAREPLFPPYECTMPRPRQVGINTKRPLCDVREENVYYTFTGLLPGSIYGIYAESYVENMNGSQLKSTDPAYGAFTTGFISYKYMSSTLAFH